MEGERTNGEVELLRGGGVGRKDELRAGGGVLRGDGKERAPTRANVGGNGTAMPGRKRRTYPEFGNASEREGTGPGKASTRGRELGPSNEDSAKPGRTCEVHGSEEGTGLGTGPGAGEEAG